jgi:hypothetical protein
MNPAATIILEKTNVGVRFILSEKFVAKKINCRGGL